MLESNKLHTQQLDAESSFHCLVWEEEWWVH